MLAEKTLYKNLIFWLMLGVSAFVAYPLLLMIGTSLKSENELYMDSVGLFNSFHFENYVRVWEEARLARMFSNSIIVTVASLAGIVLLVTSASFAIARLRFRGSRLTYLLFFSGIFIPFQLSMVPLMIVIRALGLYNNLFGLILVYVNLAIPFGIFLVAGYMKTVPMELDESARMDGCSDWTLYRKIIVPLIKPVTVTLIILQCIQIWNDFFLPNLLISTTANKTVTVGIMSFRGTFSTTWNLLMAGVTITLLPVMGFYLFTQKYIIGGMTAGAVKG
ncbi:carbohydrate ABC transporter permease [Cohnella herbarum]|uniref:Carbohydrate ABC transporter permease n=1 Tax=Cohnella herbarum TaxID=2728023 RepID=A0A7Z2VM81_9BACL|nr:carbohydrate ABC transporter permease [Cohnella herbarum]QJD85663.1 carbohydrate ABC transporter permease [Cohnella herbarum]